MLDKLISDIDCLQVTYPTAESLRLNAILPEELHEFDKGNCQEETLQEVSDLSDGQMSSILRLDSGASIKDLLMNEGKYGNTYNSADLLMGSNVNQRQSKNQSQNQDDCLIRKTSIYTRSCDLPDSNTNSRPNLLEEEAPQKPSEIDDNHRYYSACKHDTDVAIPIENVCKFEKYESHILPAGNLNKQQVSDTLVESYSTLSNIVLH